MGEVIHVTVALVPVTENLNPKQEAINSVYLMTT